MENETNIDRYTPVPEPIKQELEKIGHADLKPGDTFIKEDRYGVTIFRIVRFYEETYRESTYQYVEFQQPDTWDGTEWGEPKSKYIGEFSTYYLKGANKLPGNKTVTEYWLEANNLIEGVTSITMYEDRASDSVNTETAVMNKSSKEGLIQLQNHLTEKRNRAEIIKAFVSYEMERRRQELQAIKDNLMGVLAVFQKKIERIMRVITTIELYLGIEEELFQIQKGEPALPDEPIQFRQMVLYMDEEIGRWQSGGLDYTNIEWFDEWLLKEDEYRPIQNYKLLIPEEKGVVVFRPRRKDKKYTGDPMIDASINMANRSTYLLIRNGENLYRIFSEKIIIKPRLFPQRQELQTMLDELNAELEKGSFHNEQEKKDLVEDTMYQYKKRAVLMQGLIDRTEIFHPMKQHISIFKMDEAEGLVNFIYDDEATLPSGRLPFWDWHEQINKKIEHGSRVVVTKYDYSDVDADRFYGNAGHYRPKPGIYTVEKFRVRKHLELCESQFAMAEKFWKDNNLEYKVYPESTGDTTYHPGYTGYMGNEYFPLDEPITKHEKQIMASGFVDDLTIMYNPGGSVTHGWNDYKIRERKNRIRFKIMRSDSQVLNYDQIDLEDIDFYLTSRVDRPNYLEMMPVLEQIKDQRIEEMADEKEFMRLVFDRNIAAYEGTEDGPTLLTRRIAESVFWWKFKNQWKRPIEKDDTLALRMIERRLQSRNYENLRKI